MFSNNIKYLLDTKRITTKKILEITGHNSKSLVAMWKTGERFITTGDAIKLAIYLGITMDDLINRDLKELLNNQNEFDNFYNVNKHLLNDDDKETIKFLIEKRMREQEVNYEDRIKKAKH